MIVTFLFLHGFDWCQLILLESRGWRLQGLLYFWSFVGLSSVPSPRSWWEEVCLVLDNPQQPGSSSLLLSAWGVPNPAASMKHDETNNFVNIYVQNEPGKVETYSPNSLKKFSVWPREHAFTVKKSDFTSLHNQNFCWHCTILYKHLVKLQHECKCDSFVRGKAAESDDGQMPNYWISLNRLYFVSKL